MQIEYHLVGGPGHGRRVYLAGKPQLIHLDGNFYQRTPYCDDFIYRHLSHDVQSAIDMRMRELGLNSATDTLR